MKKKIIKWTIILIIVGCITGCKSSTEKEKKKPSSSIEDTYVLDYSDYKKITLENIQSIKITYQKESGIEHETYEEKEDIQGIYEYWQEQKIGQEIKQRCDDNTTIYTFYLKDGSKASIEKECDWLIIQDRSYDIVEQIKE